VVVRSQSASGDQVPSPQASTRGSDRPRRSTRQPFRAPSVVVKKKGKTVVKKTKEIKRKGETDAEEMDEDADAEGEEEVEEEETKKKKTAPRAPGPLVETIFGVEGTPRRKEDRCDQCKNCDACVNFQSEVCTRCKRNKSKCTINGLAPLIHFAQRPRRILESVEIPASRKRSAEAAGLSPAAPPARRTRSSGSPAPPQDDFSSIRMETLVAENLRLRALLDRQGHLLAEVLNKGLERLLSPANVAAVRKSLDDTSESSAAGKSSFPP
jgi:hypothetical protein